MSNRNALLVGATGLIGNELPHMLLEDTFYHKVVVFTRRSLEIDNERLLEKIIDFDKIKSVKLDIPVHDVYCCLGTTMKKAGSKEAFKKVDFEYPLETAKWARQHGAEQYLLVTALGANNRSVFFYNRVKGEVEEAITRLEYPTFLIFRPSLLLGNRQETRFGEKVGETTMKIVGPLLQGKLKKYQAIEGKMVAAGMYRAAQKMLHGKYIFESSKIKTL